MRLIDVNGMGVLWVNGGARSAMAGVPPMEEAQLLDSLASALRERRVIEECIRNARRLLAPLSCICPAAQCGHPCVHVSGDGCSACERTTFAPGGSCSICGRGREQVSA